MKQFITKLTVLTLAIAVVGYLVFTLVFPEYYLPVMPFLLIFFYIVTLGIHAYQLRLAKKDMGKFARSNMLITFFKLIIYSVVAVVYIAIDKAHAIPFVASLMLLYLVYTFFEVSELTKITRSK